MFPDYNWIEGIEDLHGYDVLELSLICLASEANHVAFHARVESLISDQCGIRYSNKCIDLLAIIDNVVKFGVHKH